MKCKVVGRDGILVDMAKKTLPHPSTLNYNHTIHWGNFPIPGSKYEPYPDSPTHKSNRNQDHLETLTFLYNTYHDPNPESPWDQLTKREISTYFFKYLKHNNILIS